MTFIIPGHQYAIGSASLHLFYVLMLIEALCWAYIGHRIYRKRHPKFIPDTPWPNSVLTPRMQAYIDEHGRQS